MHPAHPMFMRPYRPTDAAALTAVHNTLHLDDGHTLASWRQHMTHIAAIGGHAWVLTVNHMPIGYAAALPVPGLPGLVALTGGIAPAWQRQGAGTRLLHHMQQELMGSGVNQLSYAVPDLSVPASRFLQKNGFFIEHEEWMMELRPIPDSPFPVPHVSYTLTSFPAHAAVPLFCQLYAASFAETPWNQPFTEAEVADMLAAGDDLHFLLAGAVPIGFVGVRWTSATAATLEPVGIIKEKQGQGYGRALLQAVLQKAAAAGGTTVMIGVWANNLPAVGLYQSLGFEHHTTLYYLAHNLCQMPGTSPGHSPFLRA